MLLLLLPQPPLPPPPPPPGPAAHHRSLRIAVRASLPGGPCRCAFGSKAKAPTCMSARTVNYEYILNEVQGELVGVM